MSDAMKDNVIAHCFHAASETLFKLEQALGEPGVEQRSEVYRARVAVNNAHAAWAARDKAPTTPATPPHEP